MHGRREFGAAIVAAERHRGPARSHKRMRLGAHNYASRSVTFLDLCLAISRDLGQRDRQRHRSATLQSMRTRSRPNNSCIRLQGWMRETHRPTAVRVVRLDIQLLLRAMVLHDRQALVWSYLVTALSCDWLLTQNWDRSWFLRILPVPPLGRGSVWMTNLRGSLNLPKCLRAVSSRCSSVIALFSCTTTMATGISPQRGSGAATTAHSRTP
jgi:hypothetical protein